MRDDGLNKAVLMAFFILISIFAGIWYSSNDSIALKNNYLSDRARPISIEGITVYAEIADSKSEWEAGLSGRAGLAPQRAMLFVFPKSDYYKIWMKDMNFPIDVFWIDSDGYIVDIWHHALPDSYPNFYTPARKAKYVLETVADFADEHNIEIGDRVYKLPK